MVKKSLLIALVLVGSTIEAQEKFRLRGLLTLTPGYLTAQRTTTYGVGGELEYFQGEKFSIRSDGYWLLGKSEGSALKENYQGFLGVMYNFTTLGQWQPFVGFQPGFGLSRFNLNPEMNLRLMPVFSQILGLHYFSTSVFHFSINVRYVYGQLLAPGNGPADFSELRVAFGLGMNI